MSKSWINEARKRGELKITTDFNCPFCNPEHRLDVPTKINACKRHKWANKNWFEGSKEAFKTKSI